MISCAWQMSKALCHRWYDAFGLHDPRMLSTSACSGCFCPKARVISHAISAWCAHRATPARYHLGTVDNSYAGESSVRDRGQPAGMDAFVPTRLCRAAPDLSTSAPTVPALPEPCPRGIPHATIPWRAFMESSQYMQQESAPERAKRHRAGSDLLLLRQTARN